MYRSRVDGRLRYSCPLRCTTVLRPGLQTSAVSGSVSPGHIWTPRLHFGPDRRLLTRSPVGGLEEVSVTRIPHAAPITRVSSLRPWEGWRTSQPSGLPHTSSTPLRLSVPKENPYRLVRFDSSTPTDGVDTHATLGGVARELRPLKILCQLGVMGAQDVHT